jgi:hypothetical protein
VWTGEIKFLTPEEGGGDNAQLKKGGTFPKPPGHLLRECYHRSSGQP